MDFEFGFNLDKVTYIYWTGCALSKLNGFSGSPYGFWTRFSMTKSRISKIHESWAGFLGPRDGGTAKEMGERRWR